MQETVFTSNMSVEVAADGTPIAVYRKVVGNGSMTYELIPYTEEDRRNNLTVVELIDGNNVYRGLYRLEAA